MEIEWKKRERMREGKRTIFVYFATNTEGTENNFNLESFFFRFFFFFSFSYSLARFRLLQTKRKKSNVHRTNEQKKMEERNTMRTNEATAWYYGQYSN